MKFLIAIFAWLAWNVIIFSFDSDSYDGTGKKFPFREYLDQHWPNWLGSLFLCPIILIVGHYGWGADVLGVLEIGNIKWSDSFILFSGLAYEVLKYAYSKWRKLRES